MNDTQFLVYESAQGSPEIIVRLEDETVWLTQQQMADLFATTKQNISLHVKNVFEEGELDPSSTVKDYLTVRQEGERSVERSLTHYNLDVIISVGYRVKSAVGTRFRIWATQQLRDYLVKGFVLNDRRFKEDPENRHFEELLQRIRDIRSSEKVFWRKVLDIYALSEDYDANAEVSQLFFATVQNKMHWAAHGHTAAEVQFMRADASKPNAGLTNFPGERPIARDVKVAKNYLTQEELDALNRIVTIYLEFAELQAMNRRPMTMAGWIAKLDDFLRITEREILTHAGSISRDDADHKALAEFEKWRVIEANRASAVEADFKRAIDAGRQLEKSRKPRNATDNKETTD